MLIRIILFTLFLFCQATFAYTQSEINTNQYLSSIKHRPKKLIAFLYAMPKGGDLHNHISGATFAENLFIYGKNDNLCVDNVTYLVFQGVCDKKNLLNEMILNKKNKNLLINAWSMRHFKRGIETGHDHFFNSFGKFGFITSHHKAEIMAEIIKRAADQNESYLELMLTIDEGASGKLGKELGYNPDFNLMREKLLAKNFSAIVDLMIANTNRDEALSRKILACDKDPSQAACNMQIRYLAQVARSQAPEIVFAQMLVGFEGAMKDKRIVGLNLVQPEDGAVAIRDYKLHMQMLGFLKSIYPSVKISLHAGELNDQLVPADDLRFHIHDAVYVAKTNRVGHGVDIETEDDKDELLKYMAQNEIMVEINLSSNAAILDVQLKHHPVLLYKQYNVPFSLSSDDEGVSRHTLTKEYEIAVKNLNFDYITLKNIARNSIAYSFLPGKNIWKSVKDKVIIDACKNAESSVCKDFLKENEKANSEWQLEKKFAEFEINYQ